jgi:hypothetical protein
MLTTKEILIGNKGSDYVAIRPGRPGPEEWLGAEVEIKCGGWSGGLNTSFMKGELARLAEDLRRLQQSLSDDVEFKPLESYIKLHFSGDGQGHIHIQGEAYSQSSIDTQLSFSFDIDQTYLKGIMDALLAADPA